MSPPPSSFFSVSLASQPGIQAAWIVVLFPLPRRRADDLLIRLAASLSLSRPARKHVEAQPKGEKQIEYGI